MCDPAPHRTVDCRRLECAAEQDLIANLHAIGHRARKEGRTHRRTRTHRAARKMLEQRRFSRMARDEKRDVHRAALANADPRGRLAARAVQDSTAARG
jgi:hypothetical protein